jgi:hypothetical protein
MVVDDWIIVEKGGLAKGVQVYNRNKEIKLGEMC